MREVADPSPTRLAGACRCRAVRLELITALRIDELPLLVCSCDFCRRQQLRYTTDSDGLLRIDAAAEVRRYGFDGESAAALICGRCGAVIGAALSAPDGERAALNLNCLADAASFTQSPQPLDYDAEPAGAKLQRRQRTWTPVCWVHWSASSATFAPDIRDTGATS